MSAAIAASVVLPAHAQDISAQSYSYVVSPSGGYPDSGGGELTDGFIAELHYPSYSGSGVPYVGWQSSNPSVQFIFAQPETFGSLTVWVDDFSGSFGVTAPASISALVNGVTYSSFTVGAPSDIGHDYTGQPGSHAPGGGTPYILNLEGVFANSIRLDVQRAGEWTFVSEVQFSSDPIGGAVPEPATWAMLILGFGVIGGAMRGRAGALAFA